MRGTETAFKCCMIAFYFYIRIICFTCLSKCRHQPIPALHFPCTAWNITFISIICLFAVDLTLFTILAELLMIRLAAGLEHGRVFAHVGGLTINDPDCYVTIAVMFWFAYFSVVFFYSWDLHKKEETMVFEAHCMSFPCTCYSTMQR